MKYSVFFPPSLFPSSLHFVFRNLFHLEACQINIGKKNFFPSHAFEVISLKIAWKCVAYLLREISFASFREINYLARKLRNLFWGVGEGSVGFLGFWFCFLFF